MTESSFLKTDVSKEKSEFSFRININSPEQVDAKSTGDSLNYTQSFQVRANVMAYLQNRQNQAKNQNLHQLKQGKDQRQPQEQEKYFNDQEEYKQYSKQQYKEFTKYLEKQQRQEQQKQQEYQRLAEQANKRKQAQQQVRFQENNEEVEILQYSHSLPETFRQFKKTVLFKKILDGVQSGDSGQGIKLGVNEATEESYSKARAKSQSVSESLTLRGIENSYYQDSDSDDEDVILDQEPPSQQLASEFYNVHLQECSMPAVMQQQLKTRNQKSIAKAQQQQLQPPSPQQKQGTLPDCFLNDADWSMLRNQESHATQSNHSTEGRGKHPKIGNPKQRHLLKQRSRLGSFQHYFRQYITRVSDGDDGWRHDDGGVVPLDQTGGQSQDEKQINSIISAFENISNDNKSWRTKLGPVKVEKEIIEKGLDINEVKYTLVFQEIQDSNSKAWVNQFRLENMNSQVLNSCRFDRVIA